MEDIAGLVGLNKTSRYYYFQNKEAIFTEVVIQEARQFSGVLQTKTTAVSGCRRRIMTYLTERLRYYREVVILHNLSVDTLPRVQPTFKPCTNPFLNAKSLSSDKSLNRAFSPEKSVTAGRNIWRARS
jgi:AcrR family transcriptional regulator